MSEVVWKCFLQCVCKQLYLLKLKYPSERLFLVHTKQDVTLFFGNWLVYNPSTYLPVFFFFSFVCLFLLPSPFIFPSIHFSFFCFSNPALLSLHFYSDTSFLLFSFLHSFVCSFLLSYLSSLFFLFFIFLFFFNPSFLHVSPLLLACFFFLPSFHFTFFIPNPFSPFFLFSSPLYIFFLYPFFSSFCPYLFVCPSSLLSFLSFHFFIPSHALLFLNCMSFSFFPYYISVFHPSFLPCFFLFLLICPSFI